MLGHKSKNLSKMLVVKLRGCVEHQDIVKKDYETFAQKWSKNVIHVKKTMKPNTYNDHHECESSSLECHGVRFEIDGSSRLAQAWKKWWQLPQ